MTCLLEASTVLQPSAVTCWGKSGTGTLGDAGRTNGSRLPTPVIGVDDAVALTVGLSNACVLRHDGRVSCWGIDWSQAPKSRPAPPALIAGLGDVVQVSAGDSHVCAAEKSGEVSCWGANYKNEAGQSTGILVSTPTRVDGVRDAVAVSCGRSHTCVQARDGTVHCFGQMGYRSEGGDPRPRVVDGLVGITALASGDDFVCGVTGAGEVWCAGENNLGQLGSGDSDRHSGAVRVRGLSDVRAITAHGAHGCARTGSGEVWCWGSEFGHGVMQQPRTDDEDHGPVRIQGLGRAVDLAVGEFHACAIVEDSTIWCWGSGVRGETGHGAVEGVSAPVAVPL